MTTSTKKIFNRSMFELSDPATKKQELRDTVQAIRAGIDSVHPDSRFDGIRSIYHASLGYIPDWIANFAHANIQFRGSQLWAYVVLDALAQATESMSYVALIDDLIVPVDDKPQGQRFQTLGPDLIVLCEDRVPYFGQSRNLRSIAPDEYREGISYRLPPHVREAMIDVMRALHDAGATTLSPCDQIIHARSAFSCMVGLEPVQSTRVTAMCHSVASVLETLAEQGYPFWNATFPRSGEDLPSRSSDGQVLMVDYNGPEGKQRYPLALSGKHFVTDHATSNQALEIKVEDIFEAIRSGEVSPRIPTLILALTVAPQIPGLGGPYFRVYAPPIVSDLAEYLGVNPQGLVVSTGPNKPLVATSYGSNGKPSIKKQGFGFYYPCLGKAHIREQMGLEP